MLKCFDLTGEVAVLTGASGGLGVHFARTLAESGASLYLIARNEDRLKKTAEDISKMGCKCFYSVSDIVDEKGIENAVADAIKHFGKIDILVNCAASNRMDIAIQDTTVDQFNEVLQPNVVGTLICAKAVAKEMIKRRKGKIINIASISGLIINKGVHGGSYDISKAATIQLSRALATEWAKYNINVNTICPGYYNSQAVKLFFDKDQAFGNMVVDMIPMKRLGEPKELSGALVLLASDAANYMQGAVIVVDGGYTVW